MSAPGAPLRGPQVLSRMLAERTHDLREQELPGFRRWLDRQLARWSRSPVFAQRGRIRDLRRAHPRLAALEAEVRGAEAADRASPVAARLAELERAVRDAGKAISGLRAALESADPERRGRLSEKLQGFRERHAALAAEREELTLSSPERQGLLRLRGELEAARAAVGLDRAEAELARLLGEQGRGSGRAGREFERAALELARREIAPEAARERAPVAAAAPRISILRGVTLGAAAMELDQLVVAGAPGGRPVEVLALVEAKRNPNDLAHGFRQRQADLAWLRGERDHYEPDERRTRTFHTGHFDRGVVHRQDGEEFLLAPESFAGLRPDPSSGYVLRGLYLVTREGTLWGAASSALSRIERRVSTDPAWDPGDDAYLGDLLRWCLALADPLEAPDVLRQYAASPDLARRILWVPRGA